MSKLNDFAIHENILKCAAEGSEGTWTTARIKLLLKERFGREHDFRAGQKKKSVLWNDILRNLRTRDPEFPFMPHEIKTKFYNLLTTFKRVKKRKGKTDWRYYELFESVYGAGHLAEESQPLCAKGHFRDEIPEVICDLGDSEDETRLPPPTSQRKNTKRKPKKSSKILAFLRYQEKQEERRHREFLALKQRKVDVEVKKLQVLLDMQNLLRQALLNRNVNPTAECVIKTES